MTGKRLPAAKIVPDEPLDRLLKEAGELIVNGRLIKASPEQPETDTTPEESKSEVNDA